MQRLWRSLKDKVFVPKAHIKDYMNHRRHCHHHSHPTISIVFYCHNHFWECFQTLPLPSAHCIDLCAHKIRVEREKDPHLNIRPSINIFPIQLFQQLLEYNWIFWHICIFVFKWRQGIYAGLMFIFQKVLQTYGTLNTRQPSNNLIDFLTSQELWHWCGSR